MERYYRENEVLILFQYHYLILKDYYFYYFQTNHTPYTVM